MTIDNRQLLNLSNVIEEEKILKQMVTFAEDLLKIGAEQSKYQLILENLLYLSKAKFGILTLLNEGTGKFTTVAVAGMKDRLIETAQILGFEIVGKVWNEYAIENESIHGQVVSHFSSLSNLAGRVLPKKLSKSVEKLLDIGEVTVTKIIVNHQMIGDFSLIMPAGKHLENESLVEIYARQIDMFFTRLKAESEINKTKEYFEMTFNTSPDANTITRLSDGLIVNANDGFLSIAGYTREEILGKSSHELNLYENAADRQMIVKELSEKGYCKNEEAVFRRKDGSVFAGSMSAKITMLKGFPIFTVVPETSPSANRRSKPYSRAKRNIGLYSIMKSMRFASLMLKR